MVPVEHQTREVASQKDAHHSISDPDRRFGTSAVLGHGCASSLRGRREHICSSRPCPGPAEVLRQLNGRVSPSALTSTAGASLKVHVRMPLIGGVLLLSGGCERIARQSSCCRKGRKRGVSALAPETPPSIAMR